MNANDKQRFYCAMRVASRFGVCGGGGSSAVKVLCFAPRICIRDVEAVCHPLVSAYGEAGAFTTK